MWVYSDGMINCLRKTDCENSQSIVPQQVVVKEKGNSKANLVVEGVLTAGINGGAVAGLATSSNSKDIISLASAQIITTTAKNWIKKAKLPKVVTYPLLVGSGVAAFFLGASIVSDICFTVAVKHFNKDMKDLIKGKPIRLILSEGIQENVKRLEKVKKCCSGGQHSDTFTPSVSELQAMSDDVAELSQAFSQLSVKGQEDSPEERMYVIDVEEKEITLEQIESDIKQLLLQISEDISTTADAEKIKGLLEDKLKDIQLIKEKMSRPADAEDEIDDSESDDIEWTPPPKWVQIALVSGVTLAGGLCYSLLPLPNTGMELMGTASKMATVALRKFPLVPADGAAAIVGGSGVGINYAVTGAALAGPLVGPVLSFPLDVATDNVKMYMKGKAYDRPVLPEMPCKGKQRVEQESLVILVAEEEQAENGAELVENKEKKKEKKKKPEPPSSSIQTGILVTDAVIAVGANMAQPAGGMLPSKAISLFTSLFDMSCIRGRSSPKELVGRVAGYGGAFAAAALFDAMVAAPVKMTKIVGSSVMKLAASKEIKNISNLDFVGGYQHLKAKIKGCSATGADD